MECKMNQINIIEYEEGIKQLVKYAVEKKLIPIFGAGFTAGCHLHLLSLANTGFD